MKTSPQTFVLTPPIILEGPQDEELQAQTHKECFIELKKSKEIASEADERSQATAETLGSAHSDHRSSPHDHNGRQTCGQNPATPSPQGPGNPAGKHPEEIMCTCLWRRCDSLSGLTTIIPLNKLPVSPKGDPDPAP